MKQRFPNVLVVDDCKSTQDVLSAGLCAAGYNVSTAFDGVEALQRIEDQKPDFVITDWQMPNMDGQMLCRCIRSAGYDQYMYLLLMTAFQGQCDLIAGLTAGADAYMTKPLKLPELLACLESGSRVLELDRRLTRVAERDPLTGVMNRRNFMDSVNRILAVNRGRQLPVSCIMVDLDRFKRVNDELGHLAGDSIIIQVADVLTARFRSGDYICRFGGEEFAIILPDCNEEHAAQCAERCRIEIESQVSIVVGGETRQITASFGVSEAQQSDMAVDLLGCADRALLKVKGVGRNQVIRYSSLRPSISFDRSLDASVAPVSTPQLLNPQGSLT